MKKSIYRLPPITLLAVLVEFIVLIFVSVNATSQFLSPDPAVKLYGSESEWLTSSAQFASFSLHRDGYIPLWQPYLSHGEPLIENPFSMVLNPISTGPTLIYGGVVGLRYSVVLSTVLAALGGWALGRMMGFGSLGRVLLGLLMAGKGNMIAMVGQGYFQLGISQAYMPWVIAGTIGVLRMKHRRFPVVLTAVMLTLMFWAGNIYYVLPTLVAVVGLGLTHIISIHRTSARSAHLDIDTVALKRLIGSGLLTIGLSAVTLIPIFLHQANIGGHGNETGAGTFADLGAVIHMFFNGSMENYTSGIAPGLSQFYQSYILPLWFAVLIFVVLPPVGRYLYRPPLPKAWQVWSVGVVMIVFFTLWGAGQNPVVAWMYANVPLVGQWRFVGRMLAVASFWIAVLAALRVDSLWRAVVLERSWQRLEPLRRFPVISSVLGLGLIVVSLYAASSVIAQWGQYAILGPSPQNAENVCVSQLRQSYPDRFLAVWTLNYDPMTAYVENRVRHANISADYYAVGAMPTLFRGRLVDNLPEFGIPWSDGDRAYLRENGYTPLEFIRNPIDDTPCVWQKADALPYAFTTSVSELEVERDRLPFSAVTPIDRYGQLPDRILMAVSSEAGQSTVAVVQEVAYPGWNVTVDGAPARLESVGGILGVILPDGTGTHLVDFAYRPPLLLNSALLTLLTALLAAIYLLRLDRFIPASWKQRGSVVVGKSAQGLYTVLTSPDVFSPHIPDEDIPLLPSGEAAPEPEPEAVEQEEDEHQSGG